MTTQIIQIGNSDDKLSQADWSEFIDALGKLLVTHASEIHFMGYSSPTTRWQTCCVVFNLREGLGASLVKELGELARDFRQESIALTMGQTMFIRPAP